MCLSLAYSDYYNNIYIKSVTQVHGSALVYLIVIIYINQPPVYIFIQPLVFMADL